MADFLRPRCDGGAEPSGASQVFLTSISSFGLSHGAHMCAGLRELLLGFLLLLLLPLSGKEAWAWVRAWVRRRRSSSSPRSSFLSFFQAPTKNMG